MSYIGMAELQAIVLVLAWLLLTGWCYRHRLGWGVTPADADGVGGPLCVYASESGHARSLAEQWQQRLQHQGRAAHLLTLNQLTQAPLSSSSPHGRDIFLFISTTGEGEAPDNGNRFLSRLQDPRSDHERWTCRVAVLALGDRAYPEFCAFGVAVSDALQAAGAERLFEPVLVDNLAPADLQRWQSHLDRVSDYTGLSAGLWGDTTSITETDGISTAAVAGPLSAKPAHTPSVLLRRQCLNHGSPGHRVFELDFQCSDVWQAGDIARLSLDDAAGKIQSRDYTIASTPSEGHLRLLVREQFQADGQPGLGSGFLCTQLPLQAAARLQVIENTGFHAPDTDVPLILIGNGTGLAGLRAHLQQRFERSSTARHWLIFGERTLAHDALWQTELQQWQAQGLLGRLDLAFSRDIDGELQAGHLTRGYVQQVLEQQQQELQHWLQQGAMIYLCGSRAGMASAVDQVLRAVLGDDQVDALDVQGRYRRDVY
jgi:sulfite reductase (NADPH) flavoprotein alpha-component